jgi:hypothetical protein
VGGHLNGVHRGWGWRRCPGSPRLSASIPATPERQGDREGHTDSAAKWSEVGLTGTGENGSDGFDFGGDAVSSAAGVD